MRFFFISCFLILGGGLLSKAYAQERPSNNVWSLEDCIQYAVKQNISIQQSELQIQIDENNYLQSKISRYPDANAFANQNFAWGRSVDPFTNQFVNQRVNSNNFSISSSVTLFDGLRISNTIKRNQLNVDISRLDAEQARYDASLNVALAYLNILLNQELLEVARQNVLSTQAQLDRTLKLFEAGAVAENDVIDLRSTLATNELSVVNAENTLLLSKVSLQQLMNLPVSDDFEVVKVSVESLQVLDLAESSQQIYETSEAFLPSVRRAQLAITRDEYNIEIAKAGRYPTLNLNGTIFSGYSSATTNFDIVPNGFQTRTVGFVNGDQSMPVTIDEPVFEPTETPYTFFDQLSDNFRQQVSLSLNIPIFNRWQVRNSINNAQISKRISELSAQNTRNQLRQTIEQAYADAKSALNTYRAREKQVEALQLTFEITEKRYEAGAANIVDFNLAKINVDNARSNLIQAKYDYLFRKKVLDFYLNKPLSFE